MAESLNIPAGVSKEEVYGSLVPQLEALVTGESNLIANLANLSAGLYHGLDLLWVGFYLVENDELVLGPFQGPIACTRIAKGKGVCGVAWDRNETVIVKDVEEFNGHIVCSPDSRSEIVLPVRDSLGNVKMVLDIDSDTLANFDEVDEMHLKKVVEIIEKML